jgi:hypothetical protein
MNSQIIVYRSVIGRCPIFCQRFTGFLPCRCPLPTPENVTLFAKSRSFSLFFAARFSALKPIIFLVGRREILTAFFVQILPKAKKIYKQNLINFLLDGVGGRAEYNQPDGIHPNLGGEQVMTEKVWRVAEPLLGQEGK